MALEIRLLGRPAIVDGCGVQQAVRGLQPWALLARILLSPRDVSRREIAAELFPESVDPLGSVRWCLAALRRALGSAEALRGDPIKHNLPAETQVDIHRLEKGEFDSEQVGDLLEGVEPRCSPEFATWLLVERERIASLIDARIRQETMRAVAVGHYDQAIRLAELGVRRLPFDERAHILLVKSLALAGSYDAALEHVEATEVAFVEELGEKPSGALRSAARRTISAPPGGVSPRAIVTSLLESGRAALAAGAADAGVDCLRRAVADAEKCEDPRLHAQTLFELGSALVHSVRGYDDEGAVLLQQSVQLAQRCGDQQIAVGGLQELGYIEALAGRRPAADAHLSRALELADDPDSLAGVHAVTGFNFVDWGKPAEGLKHYDLSLDYARSNQNPRREAWSLGLGAWGHLAAGCPEIAVEWTTECLAIIDDLRWVAFRPWPQAVRAEAKLRMQTNSEALRGELEEAFALSCHLGDPCWESATARVSGLAYAASESFETALEWFAQARERCVRETDAYAALLVSILADSAECHLKVGNAVEAESLVRETLSLAARAHMDTHVRWAVDYMGRLGGSRSSE